jgi:hypothetical protein
MSRVSSLALDHSALPENYSLDHNGILHQVERRPFTYGRDYVDHFNSYGIAIDQISYLRLGFIVGCIGKCPGSVLDVGYGNGAFLKAARTLVSDCNGFDVPPAYPLPSGITPAPSLYSRHYDLVTFFDSLEHFPDIYEIRSLKCNFVGISVPWCHSVEPGWFMNWKHRKPDEHLWHFDEHSLVSFFGELGYKPLGLSSIEDSVRKGDGALPNILSAVFARA